MKALLSGNEAIALGAYHAGVSVAAAYPGTPSTEILEVLAVHTDLHAEWAPNEKVAMEVALGASYAGARALASMKHVGLNVAADPFFAASITGVQGGLVVVAADDPGMHSSQNEQDSRHYARFAKVPVLEPADSQEAYDMVKLAFALSEEFDTPVMLRPTTRVSHSKTVVVYDEGFTPTRPRVAFTRQPEKYVMIPAYARRRHPLVEDRVARLAEYAESTPLNAVELRDRKVGIITNSVAYQYVREVMPGASYLKLGIGYPLPERKIREFASQVERLIVVEELDPFIEESVKALGLPVEGKRYFPPVGELSVERVEEGFRQAGVLEASPSGHPPMGDGGVERTAPLPLRPPVMCPGCPHTGVFYTLKRLTVRSQGAEAQDASSGEGKKGGDRLSIVIAGDIGCYTLSVLPPLMAMDTTACMGASIGKAMGMQKAGLPNPVVAVIGDSTFLHSGITPLLDVVYNGGTITTIILDNGTTAMTGHQDNPSTGVSAQGRPTRAADLEKLVRGLGVEDVKVVSAFDLAALKTALRDSVERQEPSAVIVRGDCSLRSRVSTEPLLVDQELCSSCGACLQLGCPAISRAEERVWIDSTRCVGARCGFCLQVCPTGAIQGPPQEDSQPSASGGR